MGVAALGVVDLQAHALQLAAEFVDLCVGGVLFQYDDHGGVSFTFSHGFWERHRRPAPLPRLVSSNFSFLKRELIISLQFPEVKRLFDIFWEKW